MEWTASLLAERLSGSSHVQVVSQVRAPALPRFQFTMFSVEWCSCFFCSLCHGSLLSRPVRRCSG